MKCPHCNSNISRLSSALKQTGDISFCPYCKEKIKLATDWKLMLVLAIIAGIIVSSLKPWLGYWSALPLGFLLAFFATKLKSGKR